MPGLAGGVGDFSCLVAEEGSAGMWIAVEKTRALIYAAAQRGDHVDALPSILACKADAGDTAVLLANEAMTLCGGAAYCENSRVAQMLRVLVVEDSEDGREMLGALLDLLDLLDLLG